MGVQGLGFRVLGAKLTPNDLPTHRDKDPRKGKIIVKKPGQTVSDSIPRPPGAVPGSVVRAT